MKTIAQQIASIRKIENKARKLQQQLWDLQGEWNGKVNQIKAVTPLAWEDSCKAEGLVTDYNFSDILC